MSRDQRVYLTDILERIERIEQIANEGEGTFVISVMHQDAMIRNFEVIGEIVKRLDPKLTAQQAQIKWQAVAGFRDVLIHQYDKVILKIVWESAKTVLPDLKQAIQKMLEFLDKDDLPH
jgi:uncharacterized protein with HEPN domain